MNSIQKFQQSAHKYEEAIRYCISNSEVYDKNNLPEGDYPEGFDTQFYVIDATTQDAIKTCKFSSLAVLSFACKRNPAGQTQTTCSGQEADLSKISFLPTILNDNKLLLKYYVPNRETDAYGGDAVAYLPRVPFFFSDEERYIDIISCSAPSIAHLYKVSRDRIRTLLERRIDIVLSSALCRGVRNIILGAWGCGGCQLDPLAVANAFFSVFSTGYHGVFENVIFAIPDTLEDNNFDIFNSIFGGELLDEG